MELNWPLLEFIGIEACMMASQEILKIYQLDFDVYTKSDESPVTQADLNSDKIIRDVLQKSGIPVLSEEVISNFKAIDTPIFWCVDPLDGTREFVKKTDEFAINIALINDNKPILGFVCSPIQSTVWYTTREGNKKYNFKRHALENLTAAPLGFWKLVYGSISSSGEQNYQHLLEKIKVLQPTFQNEKLGSALKFGIMSEGLANLYIRFGTTSIWDTAAGHALLLNAGGDILNLDTKESLRYDLSQLSNPHFVAFNREGKEFFRLLSNENLL